MRRCSFRQRQGQVLDAWLAEPPPTFPFLKSQCQTARQKRRFHVFFQRNTTRAPMRREAAWPRVIGGGQPPSQTLKCRKIRFFCACVGDAFYPDSFTGNRGARTLYMGLATVAAALPRFNVAAAGAKAGKPAFPAQKSPAPFSKDRAIFEAHLASGGFSRRTHPPWRGYRWDKGW